MAELLCPGNNLTETALNDFLQLIFISNWQESCSHLYVTARAICSLIPLETQVIDTLCQASYEYKMLYYVGATDYAQLQMMITLSDT
jgi:hypothetical protein